LTLFSCLLLYIASKSGTNFRKSVTNDETHTNSNMNKKRSSLTHPPLPPVSNWCQTIQFKFIEVLVIQKLNLKSDSHDVRLEI